MRYPRDLLTTYDLKELLDELESYRVGQFSRNGVGTGQPLDIARYSHERGLDDLLEVSSLGASASSAAVDSRVEKAISLLKEIEVVEIELPFTPDRRYIALLLDTIRQNVGKYAICHVSVNPDLIAGMRLTLDGRLYDFSIDRLLVGLNIWQYITL